MNCRAFKDWIDTLGSGFPSPAEEEAAASHANVCDDCRHLLAAIRGQANLMEPRAQEELTQAILRRTTGSACSTAQERLCRWLDRECNAEDQEVLALHLEHCSSCNALAAAVTELSQVLPEIAEVDPGTDFTRDVLRATLEVQSLDLLYPRRTNLTEWCHRLLRRPRFAWEAAYIGALFFLLTLGNPNIRSSALMVPDFVVRGGGQILHGTSSVLSDRREAARRSIGNLEIKGKGLLDRAADYSVRTASSLRRSALSIFEEVRAQVRTGESPRDVR